MKRNPDIENNTNLLKYLINKNLSETNIDSACEKIKFFNMGKKNDWNKLLDKKLVKKIDTHFKTEMIELGYL